MAVSLIDPSGASIITHDGGLISVRCADFPGAARGTLTTPADALSAAGDVIRDEQTIAVQTTFTTTATRFALAADSVVVPLASLGRMASVNYVMFLGLRLEGNPPSNAQANSSWTSFDVPDGAGAGVGFSVGGSFSDDIDWLPREKIGEYVIRELGAQLSSGSTVGNLVLRAWGITGGDIAIFLDTLYLVPVSGATTVNRWLASFPSDFSALKLFPNGVLSRDDDEDDLWWPGKHSVLLWQSPWTPGAAGWGQIVDFQEADSEPSVSDMNGGGDWDGGDGNIPDPKSWLWFPAGGTHIPAETLITDDFSITSVTLGTDLIVQINDYLRACEAGVASQVSDFWDPGLTRRGFFINDVAFPDGAGVATCYFGDSTGAPFGGAVPGPFGTEIFRGEVHYGISATLEGVSLTDPRNYFPVFPQHLESFECVARFRLLDNAIRASGSMGLFSGGLSGSSGTFGQGWIQWDSTDADLYLIFSHGDSGIFSIFGPVSITTTYALGDWIWMRIDKRGYHWRVRVWENGSAEPGTWTIDENEPLVRSLTGFAYVDYPYDDNWSGDTDNDTVGVDPRGGPTGMAFDNGWVAIQANAEAEQARCRVQVDDFQLDWSPTTGALGDMTIHVEKYDGNVEYGTVVLPYGAHRFVAGAYDNYHFNSDSNGFNIKAWKESGSPDLMTAGIGRVFERAIIRGFRPQIYRRTYG